MAENFEMYLALADPSSDAAEQLKAMHAIVHTHRESNGFGVDGPTEGQLLVQQRYSDIFGQSRDGRGAEGGRRKEKTG